MSLRLGNPSLVPPPPRDGFVCRDGRKVKPTGQFWAYVEETDCWCFYGDFNGLVERVRENLLANQKAMPADLESAVSESICARTPANWKGCKESDRPLVNFVTWGQTKRWLKTMLNYAKDRTLVSQETAESRAQTCLQCNKRVAQADCRSGGCGGTIAGFITQLAINRSTPHDEELGACGVCGCVLKAMTWFPNETLDKASAGLEYPSDTDGKGTPCWRRAISAV